MVIDDGINQKPVRNFTSLVVSSDSGPIWHSSGCTAS